MGLQHLLGCILLCSLVIPILSYPSLLNCRDERMEVGKQIMTNQVQSAAEDSPVKVTLSSKTYTPGKPVNIHVIGLGEQHLGMILSIFGLPATFGAEDYGTLTSTSTVLTQKPDCSAQLYSPYEKYAPSSFNATWVPPDNATGSVTLKLLWAENPSKVSIKNIILEPGTLPPFSPTPTVECKCCNTYCSMTVQGSGNKMIDFNISWRITNASDNNYLMTVSLSVENEGWIGLGLQENGQMGGAYTVVGLINNYPKLVKEVVLKEKSPTYDEIPSATVENGGLNSQSISRLFPANDKKNDEKNDKKNDKNGETVLHFSRLASPPKTSDNGRKAFNIGANKSNTIILATGSSDDWGYHVSRTSVSINWWRGNSDTPSTDSNTVSKTTYLFLIHGIVMILAWSLLLPTGIIFARFKVTLHLNENGYWFKLHRLIQCVGLLFIIVGFILAVIATQRDSGFHFEGTHSKVGLVVVILACIQPLNACFRPHPTPVGNKPKITRLLWELVHKKLGYMTVLLAWLNVLVAFNLNYVSFTFPETATVLFQITAITFGVLVTLVWLYLRIYELTHESRNNFDESDTLPETMQQLHSNEDVVLTSTDDQHTVLLQ